MYEFCVADKLAEYAYDAGLAGLTYVSANKIQDYQILPHIILTLFFASTFTGHSSNPAWSPFDFWWLQR